MDEPKGITSRINKCTHTELVANDTKIDKNNKITIISYRCLYCEKEILSKDLPGTHCGAYKRLFAIQE